MKLPNLEQIEQAAERVYQSINPTPQISWPLLNQRVGAEVWVKHENHNPTGAFKIRGGLVYVGDLIEREPDCPGLCAATRGNFGQSVALAASMQGLTSTVVVPEGNSPDKNAAMQAYGAELIIHGADFDVALEEARSIAQARDLHFMPSIDAGLIPGVATYALELFREAPTLDRIYVPIGLGSGILGVMAAKAALGSQTEIIGVVSAHANTYQLSFEAGEPIGTNSADTLADGLAVRNASPEALTLIREGVARVVSVTDEEVLEAIGVYYTDTHNIAEGAGAASLAAVLKEKDVNQGQRIAVVLTGSNVSKEIIKRALYGRQ